MVSKESETEGKTKIISNIYSFGRNGWYPTNILFYNRKGHLSKLNPWECLKKKNDKLLVEVERKMHAEDLLKNDHCPQYQNKSLPSQNLKYIKWCSDEQSIITLCPKNRIVKSRCYWCKENNEERTIQISTRIFTFKRSKIPTEIKIFYTIEEIEQYIPNSLRCFKCQKFDHHK